MGERNRASGAEVMHEYRASMSWRTWETTFDGILREGGWEWWRDRVINAAAIRKILSPYPVPAPVVSRLIGQIQSIGRIPGLPDRTIARTFQQRDRIKPHLYHLLHEEPLHRPITVFGFIELKTGKARVTKEQQQWLDLANNCPGMFGLVARPEEIPYLRRVLC